MSKGQNPQDNGANVPAVNSLTANAEFFARMKETPTEQLQDESAEYLKMSENSQYDFICHGVESTQMDGKQVDVVRLEDETGKMYVHGAVVLVNAMKRRGAFPLPIRVVTRGKVKSGNGMYLDLSVYTFGV